MLSSADRRPARNDLPPRRMRATVPAHSKPECTGVFLCELDELINQNSPGAGESPSGKEHAPPIPCLEPKPDLIRPLVAILGAGGQTSRGDTPPRGIAIRHPTMELSATSRRRGVQLASRPWIGKLCPSLIGRSDRQIDPNSRENAGWSMSPRPRIRPHDQACRRRTHGRDKGTSVDRGPKNFISHINPRPGKSLRIPG